MSLSVHATYVILESKFVTFPLLYFEINLLSKSCVEVDFQLRHLVFNGTYFVLQDCGIFFDS